MAQFSNSFELLGARDFQQLIVVVDERAKGSFLEESKRKAAEEERRKKEKEKQKLRLDIKKKICYGGQRNSTTGFYGSGNRYNQQWDFNSHRFSSRPKTEDARSVSSTTSAVSHISFGTVSNGGSGVDLKRNINGVEKEEAEAVVEIQQEADKTPEQGDKTQLESNGVNESSSKKSSEGFVRRKINGSVRRKMKKTISKGGENGGAANDSSAAATAAAPTAPDEKKFTRVLTLKEYEKMKAEKDKPTVVQQPSESEDQQQHPEYRQQHPAYHHQNHPTYDQQNRPAYGQQYPAYQQNRHAYQQNNAGQFNRQNDRSWNPEKDRRGKQEFEGNRSRQAKPKAPFELDNIAEFPSLKDQDGFKSSHSSKRFALIKTPSSLLLIRWKPNRKVLPG